MSLCVSALQQVDILPEPEILSKVILKIFEKSELAWKKECTNGALRVEPTKKSPCHPDGKQPSTFQLRENVAHERGMDQLRQRAPEQYKQCTTIHCARQKHSHRRFRELYKKRPRRTARNIVEATPRFEPGVKALQTSTPPRNGIEKEKDRSETIGLTMQWSGRRGSNPRPRPWQGRALPAEPRPRAKKNNTSYRTLAQVLFSKNRSSVVRGKLEATPGFEPGVKALQASALPLGHVAILLIRLIDEICIDQP